MTVEIKHRRTGATLHTHEGETLRGADLRGAHLRGADLYGAHLHGANLGGADLYGADLHGANLGEAHLHGAYLRGADLRGADLGAADLRGADLHGAVGVVVLPAEDPRGYRLIAVQPEGDGEWLLVAGCRGPYTLAEARAHWGAGYEGDRLTGDRYLHALDWWDQHGARYRDAARGAA